MFKPDDYIVILKNKDSPTCKENVVYKIGWQGSHPKVIKNSMGDKSTFNLHRYDTTTWRYAIPKEIEMYNYYDKPVHVYDTPFFYHGELVKAKNLCSTTKKEYIVPEGYTNLVEDMVINKKGIFLWFKDHPGIFDASNFKIVRGEQIIHV